MPLPATFPIPHARISCSHLRSLELSNIKKKIVVAQFLDSVYIPSLEYWAAHKGCALPMDNMISLIEYSSFCLREFAIGGDQAAYEQVHNLLRPLDSLEVLVLHFWFHEHRPPTGNFLNLLCSPGESQPFLPHLQALTFGCSLPFSWECVSQIFASSRRRSLKLKIDYRSDTPIAHDERTR